MTDTIRAPISGHPASDAVRKAQLVQAVHQEVVAGGRVEAQSDYHAVIRYRKQIHLVRRVGLTLATSDSGESRRESCTGSTSSSSR